MTVSLLQWSIQLDINDCLQKASSFDGSRDMLHMINHFRDEMPRPLMGVGHSLGGTQL